MRILYISSSNVVGGGSVALLNLVRGVIDAGHEVMVATTSDNGPFAQMLTDAGCQVRHCHHRLSIYPVKGRMQYLPRLVKMILDNRRGRKELARLIREFHPDIVHTNVGPLDAAFDACQRLSIKHVWHQREYQDLDFGLRFYPDEATFMRKSHAEGNYNICITKGVFAHHKCREGIDTVIYDGVFGRDVCDQAKWQQKEEDYVLFAGRIEEAKGALDLLHVFADFHKRYPACRLKLAGRYTAQSAYYQQCCQFVNAEGLADAVEFLGERRDVYDLMARARMLVVPSRFEGFGFITAEAMVNGCPVVGRDTAGTKEQFDKGLEYTGGEIGLRFTDEEGMLHAMSQVMEAPMEEMCQRAFRTVEHFYTLEEHVRQVLAYYEKIMNE